ncbi:MAG: hypothetical protein J1E40_10750 [Oscillospiraceae bacterium]|nr:hypothetical protein [Oscillospiraceae bacterium]
MEDLTQKLNPYDFLVKYFNVGVTNVLSEYFDVKCCDKGHDWFTPWEGHCRKAFHLFAQKGNIYPILWGYNFDFIPSRQSNGKLIYHRTEKAVTIHFGDQSFLHYTDYYYEKFPLEEHAEIRKKYILYAYFSEYDNMNITDVASAYKYIEGVTRNNIPFMLDFFERTKTIDDIISEMDKRIAAGDRHYYYDKAFLLAYQKRMDEAIASFKMIYDDDIPEDLMARLEKVYAME